MKENKNILFLQFKNKIKKDITLLIMSPITFMIFVVLIQLVDKPGITTTVFAFLLIFFFFIMIINAAIYDKPKKLNILLKGQEFNDIIINENKKEEIILGKKAFGYYKRNIFGGFLKIYIIPYFCIENIDKNKINTKIKLFNGQFFRFNFNQEQYDFITSKIRK